MNMDMRRYRISTEKVRKRLDGSFIIPCDPCKYFHLELQEGGGWLEICEVTGGRTIWGDEVLNKSDNCPFMEVKDNK